MSPTKIPVYHDAVADAEQHADRLRRAAELIDNATTAARGFQQHGCLDAAEHVARCGLECATKMLAAPAGNEPPRTRTPQKVIARVTTTPTTPTKKEER